LKNSLLLGSKKEQRLRSHQNGKNRERDIMTAEKKTVQKMYPNVERSGKKLGCNLPDRERQWQVTEVSEEYGSYPPGWQSY
jgi:hypothetical protein